MITGQSFRGLCTLAEDADRVKKELHKLLDEEHKIRELEFYRDEVRTIAQPATRTASTMCSSSNGKYIFFLNSKLYLPPLG